MKEQLVRKERDEKEDSLGGRKAGEGGIFFKQRSCGRKRARGGEKEAERMRKKLSSQRKLSFNKF